MLPSCARRGTMDVGTTKLLSIHISALLPPTSTELDVPHIVKVAAILGIGLVYQGTAHRHIAEVLLSEIGKCCFSLLLLNKVKYMWICIARLRSNASNALRYGSHSYLQATPYLLLLPVAEHYRPLTGTHCAYPRRDGQAELTWVVD